eukprot:GHVN01061695.1.p1 GENE.GHVN01061695.1~~GHVN01061695.1.p1  ORF type:complete len:248 (-),score=79.01 GHVN01061695.1:1390-2133(-)
MNSEQLSEVECLTCLLAEDEIQLVGEVSGLHPKGREANESGDEGDKGYRLVFRVTNPNAEVSESVITKINPPNFGVNDIRVSQTFFLIITWPINYLNSESPHSTAVSVPVPSLADPRNKQLTERVRSAILAFVSESLGEVKGEPVTLSAIERVKSEVFNDDDPVGLKRLIVELDTSLWDSGGKSEDADKGGFRQDPSSPGGGDDPLKGLSKSQKRKYHSTMIVAQGSKPRGYNWVDIITHLSKGPPV